MGEIVPGIRETVPGTRKVIPGLPEADPETPEMVPGMPEMIPGLPEMVPGTGEIIPGREKTQNKGIFLKTKGKFSIRTGKSESEGKKVKPKGILRRKWQNRWSEGQKCLFSGFV